MSSQLKSLGTLATDRLPDEPVDQAATFPFGKRIFSFDRCPNLFPNEDVCLLILDFKFVSECFKASHIIGSLHLLNLCFGIINSGLPRFLGYRRFFSAFFLTFEMPQESEMPSILKDFG